MREEENYSLYVSPILQSGEVRVDLIKFRLFGPDRVSHDLVAPDEGEIYMLPIMHGIEQIYFRFIVKYHGPFTSGHETGACWRHDRDFNAFVQHGGTEYNYIE